MIWFITYCVLCFPNVQFLNSYAKIDQVIVLSETYTQYQNQHFKVWYWNTKRTKKQCLEQETNIVKDLACVWTIIVISPQHKQTKSQTKLWDICQKIKCPKISGTPFLWGGRWMDKQDANTLCLLLPPLRTKQKGFPYIIG